MVYEGFESRPATTIVSSILAQEFRLTRSAPEIRKIFSVPRRHEKYHLPGEENPAFFKLYPPAVVGNNCQKSERDGNLSRLGKLNVKSQSRILKYKKANGLFMPKYTKKGKKKFHNK
jgi:hypothetical protein